MKIEINIDEKCIPDGYDVVGFRVPKKGEYFLSASGTVTINLGGSHHPQIILKKKITFPSFIEVGSFWISKGVVSESSYLTRESPSFESGCWVKKSRDEWLRVDRFNHILGINLPDPFEGKPGGPDCLAYWDADKGELSYHGEGE